MTVGILCVVALVGFVAGLIVYRRSRPQQYRPDETQAEITSNLSRNLPPDAPTPRFTDVTRVAGLGNFRTFVGARTSQLPEDVGSGAAWGDFDNDGFDDLFLVSAGGPLVASTDQLAPCALYRNMGDGTFKKVEEFPELRIHGMGAAWGDYDGDGFLDLIITGYNTLILLHNDGGTGKFTIDKRFPNRPGFWASAAWGDFDNDRNLDLYICGYVNYNAVEADRARLSDQLGTAVPFTINPSSFEPIRNLLFHNNGDGTFTEVAEKLGVDNPKGRSLGALWCDLDDDGWLDLYVANDVSDNAFFHNRGSSFEDLSYSACVADYRSGMGLAAGDWARKNFDDLFVSHWVGQQNALFHNLRAESVITNAPAGLRFMDMADAKGLGQVSLAYVGWGAEFIDFDNDGWLDLIVANGHTLEQEGPPPKKLQPMDPFLFWNRRGEYFFNVAPLCRPLAEKHVARGLAIADYNNDGALDALIVHLGESVQLLRNDLHTGHWLKIRLRSLTRDGRPLGFGDGSKVIATAGDAVQRRVVGNASYLSQSSRTLHFGLGAATQVDRLEVRWHAGVTNFFTNLAADATWEITESDLTPRRFTPRLVASAPPLDDRARIIEFWKTQRAAMDALKIEKDVPKAATLFRAALALDPKHQDARYYLAHCLAAQGDIAGALTQLEELTRIDPQSQRGFQQWGTLRAMFAASQADLDAAERSLVKAHGLNPEETGALLVLGEISLLQADLAKADERLAAACRTNPKAVGGLFLRGYIAWKRGDTALARQFLEQTRQALGKDWIPRGGTAEGDVKQKLHEEQTPLGRFWEHWDGVPDPDKAYTALDARLNSKR